MDILGAKEGIWNEWSSVFSVFRRMSVEVSDVPGGNKGFSELETVVLKKNSETRAMTSA